MSRRQAQRARSYYLRKSQTQATTRLVHTPSWGLRMAIIAGVNIPDNKRVEVSLRSIFGIGPHQASDVVTKAGIEGNPRVRDLDEADLTRIREVIDREKMVEGDLRREVNQNIRRLIDIGCYRGLRHRRGLPVRGQRTRTNARTKRSGRRTVAGRRHSVTRK